MGRSPIVQRGREDLLRPDTNGAEDVVLIHSAETRHFVVVAESSAKREEICCKDNYFEICWARAKGRPSATGQEMSVTAGPINLHLITAVPRRFAEQVALIRYVDK